MSALLAPLAAVTTLAAAMGTVHGAADSSSMGAGSHERVRYTVALGDTVSEIALEHGVVTNDVLRLNGLDSEGLIFPGQELVLSSEEASPPTDPPAHEASPSIHDDSPSEYVVQQGDTVSGIADRFGHSTANVLAANGLHASSLIYPGQALALPAMAAPAGSPAQAQGEAEVSAPAPATSVDPEAVVHADLGIDQQDSIRLIINTGRAIGVDDNALLVALVAAAQESSLRNIDFGDRDSLGLFQQRASQGWGSREQILDPEYATIAFFTGTPHALGLADVAEWRSLSLGEAAQAVQRSAHPELYSRWEGLAREWLAAFG